MPGTPPTVKVQLALRSEAPYKVERDGSRIIVASWRSDQDVFDQNRYFWRLDPDGGNRTFLGLASASTLEAESVRLSSV